MKRAILTVSAVLCVLLAVSGTALAQCPSILFTPQQTRNDSANPISRLEAIDVDGDGVLDLIGAMDADGGSGSGVLTTWKGNGDGTFQAPVSLGTSNIDDLVLADLNNDGRKDLIMTANGQIVVRLNNGTGFDAAITTSTNYFASHVIAGPFDGDSFGDVITASASSGIVVIYHGLGNGNFTETHRLIAGALAFTVAAADFDGDTRTDVAVGYLNDNTVRVFFQNADGSYSVPTLLSLGVPADPNEHLPSALIAADVDADGKPDIVAADWENYFPKASVVIFKNLGSRTFSSSTLVTRTYQPNGAFYSLRVRDINGDGHLDIIAAGINGSMILTWAGNGDGTFRSPTYTDLGNSQNYAVTFGDFDNDTHLDLAAGAYQQVITAKGSCGTQVYLYSAAPVIDTVQSAPLRVLVSGVDTATPLPRGTVTFTEGATILGTADIDATGYAALDVPSLSLGTHFIVAAFGGNSEEGSGTSQTVSQQVTSFLSTTSLVLPASSVYGTPYTFTVSIQSHSGFTVYGFYFLDVDGVVTERQNAASVTLNLLPGPHTITASFEGDTNNAPSTSGPQMITTLKATPAIANSGGALTVRLGTAHSLQFTLTGPLGVAAPTGTVQLFRASTLIGSGTLTSGVTNISATLPLGGYDVTAQYLGDSYFNSTTLPLTLSVLPNASLAIDARGLTNAVSIRCVLPANTTATSLYRRPTGTSTWTLVSGWTPLSEFDNTVPSRGVLYDYQLSATVSGSAVLSNIDSALLFNDDPAVAKSTIIRRRQFDELRLAVNALRATAALPPFNFDGTYASTTVRASHLASLRTALTQARQALGMLSPTFTDTAASGLVIKAIHLQELRDQTR
jgi:hypothetical protein